MSDDTASFRGVLYVIVCAGALAEHIHEFVTLAVAAHWDVCVIATPQALKFIHQPRLVHITGRPVRSEYKQPGTIDILPPFDAMVVLPATFNTLNKMVLGIADTLAASLLCEGIGRGRPILVVPSVHEDHLARHPAFAKSLTTLREWGVHILYEPQKYPPLNVVPWQVILDTLHHLPLSR